MWNTFTWNDGRWNLVVESEGYFLLIGNSRWHWAFQYTDRWEFVHTAPDPLKLKKLKGNFYAWSAVGPLLENTNLDASKRININHVPLKDLPQWLGIDRALGAWGAYLKAKQLNQLYRGLIVADSGTILSITRIQPNGAFAGGQLVAGLRLQLEAMANNTVNLNDPGWQSLPPETFPHSTSDAMRRGSLQSLIGMLVEAQKDSKLPIWLCGGDGPILFKELKKRHIEVLHHPNLVMEGMIEIFSQLSPRSLII